MQYIGFHHTRRISVSVSFLRSWDDIRFLVGLVNSGEEFEGNVLFDWRSVYMLEFWSEGEPRCSAPAEEALWPCHGFHPEYRSSLDGTVALITSALVSWSSVHLSDAPDVKVCFPHSSLYLTSHWQLFILYRP